MPSNNERNCQINITGIERNLAKLTEHDNEGRIYINKETHTGNISSLRLKTDNDIVDGIYLITVYPGNGSHAIVLQISNNGKSFDVFEPNGKNWVNNEEEKFYILEVLVDNKIKRLKTSLSPKDGGLNNSGICGIWSIIISILLNGIAKEIFTDEDKKLFYDFLNNDKDGAIEFIQDIKTNFFNKTQNFESVSEVNKFLEYIRYLLTQKFDKQKIDKQKIDKQNININTSEISEPRRSKRFKAAEQFGGSSKLINKRSNKTLNKSRNKLRNKTRNKSRNKKRSKTNKKRN